MVSSTVTTFALIAGAYAFIKKVTKSKYAVSPNTSWKAYFVNIMLRPMQILQLNKNFKPMSLKSCERAAKKIAKSDTFEDDNYVPAFETMIARVNQVGYSPLGFFAAKDYFIRRLSVKLRVAKELKEPVMKPALDTPVVKPMFVTGMPRTGTTFLHRLLALDPASRAPLTFELFDPVQRYRDDPKKDKKVRVTYLQRAIDLLDMLVPNFKAIHEYGTVLPEECLVSMGSDIPLFFATFHLLGGEDSPFFSWCHKIAYKNYYKVLQLLQFQAKRNNAPEDGKRWVLKCPAHLAHLDDLIENFPDANIIWTHRDMNQSVPSFCSFTRACQDAYEGGTIQLDKTGQNVLGFAKEVVKRGDAFFEKQKGKQCASVMYTDIIKDPVGTVEKLYKDFGYEFTDEYKEILEKHVEEDRLNREKMKKINGTNKKLHDYSLEMYALTEEDIERDLGWYQKKYMNK